jgi:hypothetical protein
MAFSRRDVDGALRGIAIEVLVLVGLVVVAGSVSALALWLF